MIKYVLPALAAGILAGYLNNNFGTPLLNMFLSEYIFNLSLIALLFLMGMLFMLDEKAVAKMREAKFRILVFPFAVALGSIIGGLFGGLILRIDLFASMGVCAGYGWYTLAAPLAGAAFWAGVGCPRFCGKPSQRTRHSSRCVAIHKTG